MSQPAGQVSRQLTSQINAADLTYFVEIARTENLSRAAERLGVTQPSLSLAIKRLESSVGTPLLVRKRQGVSLTDAGRVLLQESESFIRTWANIVSRVQSSQNEVQGIVRLGCHPAVALYSLPLFLKKFLEENDGVEVRLVHDLSRKIAEGVISQQIDLGLVINPVAHPDLIVRKLATDRVTFWRSKNHRKTHGKTLIADPDLVQTQTLLRKAAKWTGGDLRVLPTSQLDVARELCALGVGIAILPERVARHGDSSLEPIDSAPVFLDELALVYRVERKKQKLVSVFAQAIADGFRA
ncbi:MAG: LysR family transcriptional regulator [Bdellovibrionota bacterium]|mgnify:FL=1